MARSYQKGSLQIKNGRWTVRYRAFKPDGTEGMKREVLYHPETGKPFTKSQEKQARQEADRRMIKINQENQTPGSFYTVGKFIDLRYRPYLNKSKLQASTRASYEHSLKDVSAGLGAMQLKSVTPGVITDFFHSLSTRLGPGSLALIYTHVKRIFEMAVDYDILDKSPLRRSLHRIDYEPEEKPVLTSEQVSQVIRGLDVKFQLMLILITLYGLRISEALGLRWQNFDSESGRLSITHHHQGARVVEGSKTSGSLKTFELVPEVAALLLAYRRKTAFKQDSDFIICRSDGKFYDDVHIRKNILYPAMEAVGIEVKPYKHGFHIFRHSAGTLLHEATNNIDLTRQFLRHTSAKTTGIYVHKDDTVSLEASRPLADRILGDLDVTQLEGYIN